MNLRLQSDIFDAAVAVLAANYAIGRTEAAMLGLLTESKCYRILNLLIDFPGLVELQKNSAARASCDSSAGPAGLPPATVPA